MVRAGRGVQLRGVQFAALLLIAVLQMVAVLQMTVGQSFPTGTAALAKLRTGYTEGIELLASQAALIMNGTFEPVVTTEWIRQVMSGFVTPTLGEGYLGTAMTTPEEFWPVTGLFSMTFDNSVHTGYELLDSQVHQNLSESPRTPVAVFGYSQSAIIASLEKRTLATEFADRTDTPQVSFVMTGNPYRPNGGFLSRLPLLARLLNPSSQMTASPTDTVFATHDVARQYDMWADFPTYPLNLLADINALFGLLNHWYLPASVNPLLGNLISTVSLDPASPNYNPDTLVQRYGDTTYYTIPSEHLPMLYPLRWIGLGPLTDVIEPTLKVLVELGYDRSAGYGQVARARLFPCIDPGKLAQDLGAAFAEGGNALHALFTPPVSAPVGGGVAAPAAAQERRPIPARRASGPAKPVRSAAAAEAEAEAGAGAGAEESPQSRPVSTVPREPRRTGPRHSSSSKIATARVQPADAA